MQILNLAYPTQTVCSGRDENSTQFVFHLIRPELSVKVNFVALSARLLLNSMESNNADVPNLNKIPIGSTISLITSVQYRYEGKVAAINSIENTITLQHVRFWGAESRCSVNPASKTGDCKSPAIGSLFDSVTFWMSNVLKLHITDKADAKKELSDIAVKAASTAEFNDQPSKPNPIAAVRISYIFILYLRYFELLYVNTKS